MAQQITSSHLGCGQAQVCICSGGCRDRSLVSINFRTAAGRRTCSSTLDRTVGETDDVHQQRGHTRFDEQRLIARAEPIHCRRKAAQDRMPKIQDTAILVSNRQHQTRHRALQQRDELLEHRARPGGCQDIAARLFRHFSLPHLGLLRGWRVGWKLGRDRELQRQISATAHILNGAQRQAKCACRAQQILLLHQRSGMGCGRIPRRTSASAASSLTSHCPLLIRH
mmetsp:Transcript_30566/g.49344  ORF Transcript_30566/g.49344 Transcript_30566/m.49344 type:complete len:225 (-) Transcript_30566:448-1122(-)